MAVIACVNRASGRSVQNRASERGHGPVGGGLRRQRAVGRGGSRAAMVAASFSRWKGFSRRGRVVDWPLGRSA